MVATPPMALVEPPVIDLGVLVELVEAVGDAVEVDDVLPQTLGSLREEFVKDADAFLDLVGRHGESPEGERFY